jgi:GNAT superfamily N-acetyltransferase
VNLVRELQERAARALPAAVVVDASGWLLRHAPGCSWWVSSVLPHADGSLSDRVAAGGGVLLVPRYGRPVPDHAGVCPLGLDGLLAARGYRLEGPVSLQVSSSALLRLARVRCRSWWTTLCAPAWFDAWSAIHGGDPVAERALLSRVTSPSAYASAVVDSRVVAVGRAVLDTGWVGVFGMATLPSARGRGAARSVLTALTAWASGLGAENHYLQVERDNTAALGLYASAGFTEAAAYHYRTAPR